jgi:hypothetical protein
MKTFACTHCASTVYFENLSCGACGHALGFEAGSRQMWALAASPGTEPALWTLCTEHLPPTEAGSAGLVVDTHPGAWKLCANHVLLAAQGQHVPVCNWMLHADDPNPLCASCRTTTLIPDLSVPGHAQAWQALEAAKRRLFEGLLQAGLPLSGHPASPQGPQFHFLADVPGQAQPVLTGHDSGTITVNLAEADDATRAARRAAMHEPYRTLLGHLRHEIGHYYWDVLVAPTPHLDEFRALFGDERQDYAEALSRHYQEGPAADWAQHAISSYATAHPWEDWAETWAHYLHIMDGLDTARHWGVSLLGVPALGAAPAQQADIGGPDLMPLVTDVWLPLARFLNSMGRGLGQGDLYPFVMPTPVLQKLAFVHTLVGEAKAAGAVQPLPAAEPAPSALAG